MNCRIDLKAEDDQEHYMIAFWKWQLHKVFIERRVGHFVFVLFHRVKYLIYMGVMLLFFILGVLYALCRGRENTKSANSVSERESDILEKKNK